MSGETEGFVPPEYFEGEEGTNGDSIKKSGETSVGKEQSEPLWREKVLEGMSQEDQEAIRRMRSFFEEKGPAQRWYYSGAGGDISPTLIAPSDTEHWWVDPSYEASTRLYLVTHQNINLENDITNPYRTLGAPIEEAVPWEQAWQSGRQTLSIDNRTTIKMVGGVTQDKETAPEGIDVIYTNPLSTFPGPDVFINLREGGYYVSVTLEDSNPKLDIHLLEYTSDNGESKRINLQDLGFRHIRTEEVTNWDFPAVGRIRGTTTGKKLRFNIYEKTREFTLEEKDILRLDSTAWEISGTYDNLIGIGLVSADPEFRRLYEEEFRGAVRRYFERINNLKGDSQDIADSVGAYVEDLIKGGEDSPEQAKIRRIYEEVKNSFGSETS